MRIACCIFFVAFVQALPTVPLPVHDPEKLSSERTETSITVYITKRTN